MHPTAAELVVSELALSDADLHIARKALERSPKAQDERVQALLAALDAEATRRKASEERTVRKRGGRVSTQIARS